MNNVREENAIWYQEACQEADSAGLELALQGAAIAVRARHPEGLKELFTSCNIAYVRHFIKGYGPGVDDECRESV